MSYKALYRIYRPKNLEEVKGQEHIILTFKNIISKNKVSHAYLFAGPRGTGKTSVAYVLAKTLNCSDLQGGTQPCEQCEQCISTQKASLDIIEIDAASNNGVAEVRAIIDNSRYSPSISKYKVYIIDEVHMLSKGAFNALLKILEEPPAHVIFILATTEPHKIPITILSRIQRFNFRRIPNEIIIKQVTKVLDTEKIQYDDKSIKLIAKLSNGGMRDALSIADQVSAYANNKISFEAIAQVFGIVSIDNQIKLIQLVKNNQINEMLFLTSQFIEEGVDIEKLVISLIDIFKDSIIFAKTSDVNLMELLSYEEVQTIQITTSFAYKAIDILIKLLSNLRFSEVPRQTLELSLLKLTELNSFIDSKIQKEVVNNDIDNKQDLSKNLSQVDANKTDLMNLFTTKELNEQNTKKVVVEDEFKKAQQGIKENSELDISTQIIQKEDEEKMRLQEIDEEIISTQEIPLSESKETIKNTEDMSAMELFNIDESKKVEKIQTSKTIKYSISEIINLLLQANKDSIAHIKSNWYTILSYSSDPTYGEFVTTLDVAKIISAGDGFILVSSEENDIVFEINSWRKNADFINFSKLLFGKPQLLFAITKEQFQLTKQSWKNMANNNSFPKPIPIQKIEATKKEHNEVEEFGTSLFGDIFNS